MESFSPDSMAAFEGYLTPLIENPSIQLLLLNCEAIDSIPSAAWGLLTFCHRRMKERQARFALCEGNRLIQAALRFMRLEEVIQHFVTQEEALRSMRVE